MKVFNALKSIPNEAKGCVIAIGNFDGVHRGHQALIAEAAKIAKEKNAKLGVLTFEPHPRRLFQPSLPPARLTPTGMKAHRLEAQHIDYLFSLEFDWDFASQTADDFIQNILIEGLEAKHIVVGDNFCFGQLRKGSPETIKKAGIDVTIVEPILDENSEIISSSRIREALRKGNIEIANSLLGWNWEVSGTIVRGDRRGHELGYPTANVLLNDTLHPAYGIYASKVLIEGENEWRPAATNIGIRPMFEVEEGQVEAHILEFPDKDIYDRILRIQPIKRLRGEAKFNSLDDLIEQMGKDCQKTLEILS
ncbi:MAG: bifunctional riboflavin kinase/FAD synthetase [Pseudomonadota bacterium]